MTRVAPPLPPGDGESATPLVSVAIPAYNAAATLGEALDSVLNQTYPRLEIIVVDDGSSDGTAAILQSYGTRIRTISQANAGLAGARNAGLLAARGELIALFDADDLCMPTRIAAQASFLQALPHVMLCASDFGAFNSEGPVAERYLERYYASAGNAPGGVRSLFDHVHRVVLPVDGEAAAQLIECFSGMIRDRLIWGNFLHPPTVMFRRSLLEQVGLLAPRFRYQCDYQWLLRASGVAEIGLLPLPLIRYRLSPTQMSADQNTWTVKTDLVRILEELRDSDVRLWSEHAERLNLRLADAHYGAANYLREIDRRRAWGHALAGLRLACPPATARRALIKLLLPEALLRLARAWMRAPDAGAKTRPGRLEFAPILRGAVRFVPFASDAPDGALERLGLGTGESGFWNRRASPRYGYGLWLKHLTLLHECGMEFPATVAEIGPGDSLGLGITALVSGVRVYHAFDVRPYANLKDEEATVDDVAGLLRRHEPRPSKGWPDFDRHLDPGLFPAHVLTPKHLEDALAAQRIEALRRSIAHSSGAGECMIRYVAPWVPGSEPLSEYDLVLSHSVLEYVEDLPGMFDRIARMLKPGGWMSHQVDLSSLAITRRWNGHLAYPPWLWQVVAGRRTFHPNRKLPLAYLEAMRSSGFDVVWIARATGGDVGLARASLAREFRSAPDEELSCRALFVIARLRPRTAPS